MSWCLVRAAYWLGIGGHVDATGYPVAARRAVPPGRLFCGPRDHSIWGDDRGHVSAELVAAYSSSSPILRSHRPFSHNISYTDAAEVHSCRPTIPQSVRAAFVGISTLRAAWPCACSRDGPRALSYWCPGERGWLTRHSEDVAIGSYWSVLVVGERRLPRVVTPSFIMVLSA